MLPSRLPALQDPREESHNHTGHTACAAGHPGPFKPGPILVIELLSNGIRANLLKPFLDELLRGRDATLFQDLHKPAARGFIEPVQESGNRESFTGSDRGAEPEGFLLHFRRSLEVLRLFELLGPADSGTKDRRNRPRGFRGHPGESSGHESDHAPHRLREDAHNEILSHLRIGGEQALGELIDRVPELVRQPFLNLPIVLERVGHIVIERLGRDSDSLEGIGWNLRDPGKEVIRGLRQTFPETLGHGRASGSHKHVRRRHLARDVPGFIREDQRAILRNPLTHYMHFRHFKRLLLCRSWVIPRAGRIAPLLIVVRLRFVCGCSRGLFRCRVGLPAHKRSARFFLFRQGIVPHDVAPLGAALDRR